MKRVPKSKIIKLTAKDERVYTKEMKPIIKGIYHALKNDKESVSFVVVGAIKLLFFLIGIIFNDDEVIKAARHL